MGNCDQMGFGEDRPRKRRLFVDLVEKSEKWMMYLLTFENQLNN